MFRTKRDVDRHVQDVMRKLKNEKERSLRCYNIAKLYFMVGEYELARRYVSNYLTVREDSASAHKLLGEALEKLGQKEKALAQYKCSLELESKQQDLVLKVCELLVDSEASLDVGRARYWCERAEQLFPHHPTVFRLKEHLLTADGEEDAAELEALIASELTARPTDVSLRVRLLRLYLDTERLTDAYNHAVEVELRAVPGFRDQLQWYDCLIDVFETYQEECREKCDWEFHMHYVSVLERATCLSLQENQAGVRRSIADCVQALFSFDKALHQASAMTAPPSERELFQEFLKHVRGQLCLHLATLVLKKANKERGNWREACRVSSPLLLLALSPPIDMQSTWLLQATETRKKTVDLWAKETAYRNSQAGHVLLSMVRERRSQFLDRISQYCSGNWRERVFQRIFTTRDHQQGMSRSHFVNFPGFSAPPMRLPTQSELLPHDEKAQKLHPGSLHHLVWLGLQDVSNSNKKNTSLKLGPDFQCQVFEGLQLTCNNLNCAGMETLNRLDIDAFLYAAVFCASATQEEQQAAGYWSADRPVTLPANIIEQLCTVNQAKWWAAAYRVYTNQAKGDLGELRLHLQRGIEVVRVLGNHGLDVKLIIQLAQTFEQRAATMAARTEGSNDLPAIEARASLYWMSALPLLERLQRNQAIRAPHTRLFEYQGKELSSAEVNALIEEGRFFLACQLMKEDKHEKAIEAFQQLKSPYASFYQATIYKKLAAEELEDQRREMITSEMRSQHIILLTKARECYYLTLDRLRSPGVDAKHPLNAELNSHIEEIESQLSRIDPDVMIVGGDVNRNECDGMSDDSVSSPPSAGDNLNNSLVGLANSSSLYLQHSSLMHLTPRHRGSAGGQKYSSTPYRSNVHKLDNSDMAPDHPRRTEARPSPERLDAQIRHLVHSKDTAIQTILEQIKTLLEQSKAVVDGLRENKLVLEEMKNQIQELRKDTMKLRRGQTGLGQTNMNAADLSQVCDPEEDLYVFDDEDYTEDVNLAAAQLGQYQPFPPYPPNYTNYRGMSGILGTPSGHYPAPHSGTQTPLLPPQPPPAIGGFFGRVDPTAASLIYPPTLGYYAGQGSLPFSEGQQLPNFGTAGPGIPTQAATASIFSRLGVSADSPGSLHDPKVVASTLTVQPQQQPPPPVQPVQHQQQPVGPVNVVITSSDTLPTSAPANQPTLSVTIPPQHRLGTPLVAQPPASHLGLHSTASAFTSTTVYSSTTTTTTTSSVPHAFQISMPPQAQLPHASLLEKGAASLSPVLPISTGMLLSSVPSPVYSALEKSPAAKESIAVSGPGGDTRRVSTGSAAGAEEEGEEGEEGDHDPCPDYQPVIPLPAEVELTTGEEEETALFESRSKLYRYVEKEWKERGIGIIKLLHNQKTGKVRVLMRREQVLKICANHNLRPDMELTQMNDRAWMWVAHDFADEEVRLEKLCVRFKTADEAANFKDAFDKAKTIAAAAEPSPIKGSAPTPLVCTTPVMQQPSKIITKVVPPVTSSTSAQASSNKITVGGFTFASPPTFKTDTKSTTAQLSSKDTTMDKDKVGVEAAKTSPFAGFSFTSPPKPSTADSTAATGSVSTEPAPLRRPRTTLPKAAVSSPSPVVSSTAQTTSQCSVAAPQMVETKAADSSGTKLMFDSSQPNLTFSALASATKATGFKKDENFKGWEGAGQSLFSGTPKNKSFTADADANENESTAEEFVPTAEFKPVIPLPELVDVKTGEEGENVLFEERAKLLRFDSEGKQWKERGIGKLKVMQDPSSGKVRLLMRREQVLKVCCNHFVTADMKFSALSTSDRAWTWYAQDYSEEEMKAELLAVKFKTVEQALAFKKVLDDVQTRMTEKKKETVPAVEKVKSPQADVWKCKECIFPNAADANHCLSCKKSRPRQLKESTIFMSRGSDQQPKLMEIPKSSDIWECQACRLKNDGDSDICIGCKKPNSSKAASRSSTSSTKPLSELFKAKPGSWECKTCCVRNDGSTELCLACESPKPGSNISAKPVPTFSFGVSKGQNTPLSELFKPKTGSWECKACYTRNDADKMSCVCCNGPKPGQEGTQKAKTEDTASQPAFKFGMPSSGAGFIIGSSAESTTGQNNFKFGIPVTSSTEPVKFNFGIPVSSTSTSAATSTTAATTTAQPLFAASGTTTSKGGFSFGFPNSSTSSANVFGTDSTSTTKPFVFEPKTSSGAFLFGSSTNPGNNSSSLTFSFGSGTVLESKKESTPPRDTAGHKFTFGSPGKFEFNFSGIRPKSPTKSPKSPGVGSSTSVAAADEDESGSEPEEDEGEHIYFQPVIPLPDKVPLHTGEEEEDVLYCHRAKLFRFTSGEWKERGVGDIKVLKHRNTHKVRLLMRRDQVLKLCLNHFLRPEINFLEKDEKTWLWSAPDYSEGQVQEERFAIRFKNKEVAGEFKQAIDKAQTEMRSSFTDVTSLQENVISTTPSKEKGAGDGSGDAISPAMKNFSFTLPSSSPAPLQPQGASSPVFSLSQFGTPSPGSRRSLFGGTSTTSVAVIDLTDEKDDVEVVYELKVTPEEEAAALRLKLPANFYSYRRKPPCPGCAGCEPDSDSETEVYKTIQDVAASRPASSPKKVSPFSALKTPTSGGQQSTPTTTASSTPTTQSNQKLTSVTSSQQTAVLSTKHSSASDTKALPQFVPSVIPSFGLKQQTAPIFSPQTSSTTPTSQPHQSPLFNTQQQTSGFGQSKPSQPQQVLASPKLNTSINSQTTLTSIFSQPQSSISSQQASTPAFGQQSPASTTPGTLFGQQSQHTSLFSSIDSSPKTTFTMPAVGSGFTALSTKLATTVSAVSSDMPKSGFIFSPAGTKPPTTTDSSDVKPLTFNFSSSLGLKPTAIPPTSGPEASSIEPSLTFSSPVTKTSFNLDSVASSTTEVAETSSKPGETEVPFLPCDSSLSFANLASKSEDTGYFKTETNKNFSWAGAGSTVFGSSRKQQTPQKIAASGDGNDSSGDEGGADDSANNSHDPHFEPVIDLPDTIEVRTGEEEETKVFCHRAKLYRFEAATKEWKERGVGEMKILHHPINNTYRLLLRREQVHKVVCNHLVTPDLAVKPLSTSNTAWCWGALNYADGDEPKVEELAVRFKLTETAQEFMVKLNECIEQIAKQQVTISTVEEPVSPQVTQVSQAEAEAEDSDDNSDDDAEDDEDEDDDEDEEESEKTLMFEKRATLFIQDPQKLTWKQQGLGDLQVVYDTDIFGARICVEKDGTGEQLCNTVIAINTALEVRKRDCIWSGLDYTEDPPVLRKFMAKFSSDEATEEFKQIFQEGKDMAEQSEILEHVNPAELSPEED
ncbi:E3 SUMO-protein ligase RanBP2 isoform X2 [Periplaneta americana]|uniref:E3 SUMO-protein ligase RanBP2 isoform X2 n=1 Tax=Periplaneta americana TaxID=6978 RepID=UPI0037E748D9